MAKLLSKHFLHFEKQKNVIGFPFSSSGFSSVRIVWKSVYFFASLQANF